MGKKHRARTVSAPAARPSGETSGLIAFIQQLLQERRLAEALRAGQTLVENEPLNPVSHAILAGLLMQVSQPADAMRQYEMALRLGIASRAEALHGLVMAASAAQLPFHARQAARMGLDLNATSEQRNAFEAVIAATDTYLAQLIAGRDLATDTAEQALLLTEQSSRATQVEDAERARLRATEATRLAPGWPVVWHFQAIHLFSLDDLPAAIAACAQGLAAVGDDDSLLLATLVRFHAAAGQVAEAQAALDRLTAIPDPGVSAAEDIAKGLAALDRDDDVYNTLIPFAAEDDLHTAGRFLLGTAAANRGRLDEARGQWRNLAREGMAHVRAYTDMLVRHEQPPTLHARFPYFAAVELVPLAALVETISLAQRDLAADIGPIAARYPRLADALSEALFLPGLDPRLAISVLLRLADPAIPDAIRRFAGNRGMGDYDRLFAHVALRGAAHDDPATPATVWLGGRRREMLLPALQLKNEDAKHYGEQVATLMQQAAEAQEQDNSIRAAELYGKVLEIDPELADAEHNLGTAYLLAGHMQEGEAHVRRALELDPEYVLARCNLASLELTRGNVLAAHEFLDPLETRRDYTPEEMLAYLRTRSDLARADVDLEQAETLLHVLLAFDHDNSMARERLASLVAQPAPAGR